MTEDDEQLTALVGRVERLLRRRLTEGERDAALEAARAERDTRGPIEPEDD